MPLTNLPPEVLSIIPKYLDSVYNLYALLSSCRYLEQRHRDQVSGMGLPTTTAFTLHAKHRLQGVPPYVPRRETRLADVFSLPTFGFTIHGMSEIKPFL